MMKHLRWLPLAFVADVHGFAIFAPYASLMMALAIVVHRRARQQQQQVRAAVVRVAARG